MESSDLFWGTSGPPNADIVVVGEAWGYDEHLAKRPFVGTSGNELDRMLGEAGIRRDSVLCTNVISERPENNEMWKMFHPKDKPSGTPSIRGLDPAANIRSGLSRLYQQIAAHPRRVVIGTGNYPLWALSDCAGSIVLRSSNGRPIPRELQPKVPNGIMNWRGSMWYFKPHDGPQTKTPFVPIIHPAAIQRQWSNRACTVHDLKLRVTKHALQNDWRHRVEPVFLAPPTFVQAKNRLLMWLAQADGGNEIYLAEDIETARSYITCVGLGDSPHFAMSIPFIRRVGDRGKAFDSYWTVDQEAELISLIRRLNTHPKIRIIGQNFIYDTQYFQFWMAHTPRTFHDCMLVQNVLFPGTPKGLDYLSSLYCDYHWFWKEDHKEWDLSGTLEDLLRYNCWDIVRTFEVAMNQIRLIHALGQESQVALKMRVHDFCLKMMQKGIKIDLARRNQTSLDLMNAMSALEQELAYIIPQDVVQPDAATPWYRSDKQTAFLFYQILGFAVQKDRKTKQPSVGKEARMKLHKLYPEFGGLFERLRIYGSAENTNNVLNAGLDSDWRLRSSLNPGGTETHRLSSSKTPFGRGMNLQNLTKGEEDD